MSAPIHISSPAQLSNLVSSTDYVLLDFHASWCGPCHMIAPVFDKLSKATARDGKLAFAKIDVDDQVALAQQFNISAMPTFILVKDGQIVEQVRGANPPVITGLVKKVVVDLERREVEEKTAPAPFSVTENPSWKMAL